MKRININLVISVIIIATFIMIGAKLTATGNSNEMHAQMKYYQELENNYKNLLSEVLGEQGYRNCGVNILSVTDINGQRSYTVNIHHNKINELSEEERTSLLEQLNHIKIEGADSTVEYSFI